MTKSLPEYRLRLFLSVDLVGSTAFKARMGDPSDPTASPNPAWVQEMARFYRGFPDELERAYMTIDKPADWDSSLSGPRVWKTIGDEIVFCCRVNCYDHLAICVKAFTVALDKYGQKLDGIERPGLDLKGYGWIAAFPYPNVTVRVFDQNNLAATDQDLPYEEIEKMADVNPASYDFLGKDIDTGFRIGKNSSSDSLALSIELAQLLSSHGNKRPLDGIRFSYAGRQTFKGVMGGRPYPVVLIDVERNLNRRKVRHYERALGGLGQLLDPIDVNAFALAFMENEAIETPWLKSTCSDTRDPQWPADYLAFQKTWMDISKEIEKREKSERDAADSDGPDERPSQPIDPLVSALAQDAVKRATVSIDSKMLRQIASLGATLEVMKHAQPHLSESALKALQLAHGIRSRKIDTPSEQTKSANGVEESVNPDKGGKK